MHKEKIPDFYTAGEFGEFESLFKANSFPLRQVKRGQVLTTLGAINNTSYFIKKGIIRFSLLNENGKEKTVSLWGPGEIFPIGVKVHHHKMDYEMVLTAFSKLEIYQFSYLQLRELASQNAPLAMRLLESDCDFISYLFYMSTSLAFSPVLTRICDVLYLYIPEKNRNLKEAELKNLSQEQLAAFVGASKPEVERALRYLRKEELIQTGRNHIFIPDVQNLLAHCSANI